MNLVFRFGLEVLAAEQLPQTYKVVSFEDPEQPLPSTYVTFVFNYRSPGESPKSARSLDVF